MRLIQQRLADGTSTIPAADDQREVIATVARPEDFAELPFVKDTIAAVVTKWPFTRFSLQPITVNYALIAEHGSPVRQYYIVGLIDHITDEERAALLAHFPTFKIDYAHLRAVAAGEADESGQ